MLLNREPILNWEVLQFQLCLEIRILRILGDSSEIRRHGIYDFGMVFVFDRK